MVAEPALTSDLLGGRHIATGQRFCPSAGKANRTHERSIDPAALIGRIRCINHNGALAVFETNWDCELQAAIGVFAAVDRGAGAGDGRFSSDGNHHSVFTQLDPCQTLVNALFKRVVRAPASRE